MGDGRHGPVAEGAPPPAAPPATTVWTPAAAATEEAGQEGAVLVLATALLDGTDVVGELLLIHVPSSGRYLIVKVAALEADGLTVTVEESVDQVVEEVGASAHHAVYLLSQYTTVSLTASVSCSTVKGNNLMGGLYAFVANESISIGPGGAINCAGYGFFGGVGGFAYDSQRGAGWYGGIATSVHGSSGGGGGGKYEDEGDSPLAGDHGFSGGGGAGAGGGGYGASYTVRHDDGSVSQMGGWNGAGGVPAPSYDQRRALLHGCGGGGGANDDDGDGGQPTGGNGGGVILLIAPFISMADADAGALRVDGNSGTTCCIAGSEAGAGGGGGGGSIVLMTDLLISGSNTWVSRNGGPSRNPTGATNMGLSGAGGIGRATVLCDLIKTSFEDMDGERCGRAVANSMAPVDVVALAPLDFCPDDETKETPGFCGCGVPEPAVGAPRDTDNDQVCVFNDPHADNELVCVDIDTIRSDPETPCAICDSVRDRRRWSSIEGTCYIDGACYDDDEPVRMENSAGVVLDWPCEACNRTLDQNEWTFVERHCRIDGFTGELGLPPAPFNERFEYFCLSPYEATEPNVCRGCVGEWRTDGTDKSLGPGSIENLDFLPCDDDETCTTLDRCIRGECVAHVESFATDHCVGRECSAYEHGSIVHDMAGDELGYAAIATSFTITRPGGAIVDRIAVPTDAAEATRVTLTNADTGDVLLDIDFDLLGEGQYTDSVFFRMFLLPEQPLLHLPVNFNGILTVTSSTGSAGFAHDIGATEGACWERDAADWMTFSEVALGADADSLERAGVDCSLAAAGVGGSLLDFPGDVVAELAGAGGSAIAGTMSNSRRLLRFTRTPTMDTNAVIPLRWSGPQTSRFIGEEYMPAGLMAPPLADEQFLCGRIEGSSGNLPTSSGSSLRIVRNVDTLPTVAGTETATAVIEGSVRGRDSAILVDIIVDDTLIATFNSTGPGSSVDFSGYLGDLNEATRVIVQLTASTEPETTDPLTDFGPRFDNLKFGIIETPGNVVRGTIASFSRKTTTLGLWGAECVMDEDTATTIGDEEEVVGYGNEAIDVDDESTAAVFRLPGGGDAVTIDLEPLAPSGDDVPELPYSDSGDRAAYAWVLVDDTADVDFVVDIIVDDNAPALTVSCSAATACDGEGDLGVIGASSRVRVRFSATDAGATGQFTVRIGEASAIFTRAGAITLKEELYCNTPVGCVENGVVAPDNECLVCATDLSVNGWTSRAFKSCSGCEEETCSCSILGECVPDSLGQAGSFPDLPEVPSVELPSIVVDALNPPPIAPALPTSPDDVGVDLPVFDRDAVLGQCSSLVGQAVDAIPALPSADFFTTAAADINPLADFPVISGVLTTVLDVVLPIAGDVLDVDLAIDLSALETVTNAGTDVVSAVTDGLIASAGDLCFVIPSSPNGIAQLASTVLGVSLPSLPVPNGIPDLADIVPKTTAISLPLTGESTPTDIEFDMDIPDAPDCFAGVVGWTNAVGRFSWSEKRINMEADVSLSLPFFNRNIGDFFVQGQFKFIDFSSLPGIALQMEAVAPARRIALIGTYLYVTPISALVDIGAGQFQLTGTIELVLPDALGSTGVYTGRIFVQLPVSGDNAPAFADAEADDDTAAEEVTLDGDAEFQVTVDVEAAGNGVSINVVPSILTVTPKRFFLDSLETRLSAQAEVSLDVPGFGAFGVYDAVLDLSFDGTGPMSGSASLELSLTATSEDPIVLMDDVLEIRPVLAHISLDDAMVDLQAEVLVGVPGVGPLAHVAGQVLLQWEDKSAMLAGSVPSVTILIAPLDPDNPVEFELIPGVASIIVRGGELNSAESFIRAACDLSLSIPGVGHVGDFNGAFSLDFPEPELRGSPDFTLSLDIVDPIDIDLIPELVRLSFSGISLSSAESFIRFSGSIELPLLPNLDGVLSLNFHPAVVPTVDGSFSGSVTGGSFSSGSGSSGSGSDSDSDSNSAIPNPFAGIPDVVLGPDPSSLEAMSFTEILASVGLPASAIDSIPLPLSKFGLKGLEIDVSNRALSVAFGTLDPSERLTIVPGLVTVFNLDLEFNLQFGSRATLSTTTGVAASSSRGDAPSSGTKTSVGFRVTGNYVVGPVAGLAFIERSDGEWFFGSQFERLSAADIASSLIGGLPGSIDTFLSVFDLKDVLISVRIGGKAGAKTLLFHLRAVPDSDLINSVIGEDSAIVEVMLGKLDGKKLMCVIVQLDIENLMGYIGNLINFPQISAIPFAGASPLSIALSNQDINFLREDRLTFGEVAPPPRVGDGISFGFPISAPPSICTGLCREIVDVVPGFSSVYVALTLGRVDGSFAISFIGILPLQLQLGPIGIEEVSFNVVLPIPNVSKIRIFMEAVTSIALSPTHTVFLEFRIGYKPYTVFASAFFNGYLPYYFLPFFTAGDFFIEAEINEAPTIAFGMSILFGRDCLDERGRPDLWAGCALASGAVGLGVDQFIQFSVTELSAKSLFRAAFGEYMDYLPIPFLDQLGLKEGAAFSFSAKERYLPNGQYLPVGFYVQGPIFLPTNFLLVPYIFLGNGRVLLPITPTMIKMLIPGVNGALATQFAIELLKGYELRVEISPPPLALAKGAIQLVKYKDDFSQGPAIKIWAVVKPANFEFGFAFGLYGYINIINLVEIDVKVTVSPFGFEAEFFTQLIGIRVYFYVNGQLMGGNFSPTALAESGFKITAIFDASQFTSVILDPVNNLMHLGLDALAGPLGDIPAIGDQLVDYIDEAKAILTTTVRTVLISANLDINDASYEFQLDAQIFGKPLRIRLKYAADPLALLTALWEETIKPWLARTFQPRSGPSFMHCDANEDQFAITCWRKCRPGYKAVGPTCMERCRSGYADLGLSCLRVETRGPSWKCCGKKFGVCYCYKPKCPGGFFWAGTCVRRTHYWKHIYPRNVRPIHRCSDNGRTSKEWWTLLPMCYEPCGADRRGMFSRCIADAIIPPFLRDNWCSSPETCSSLLP